MILVFASKKLGFNALSFLIRRGDPVQRVVVAAQDDAEIVNLCNNSQIQVDTYNPNIIRRLIDEGIAYTFLLNLFSPVILPKSVLALAAKRVNLHTGLVPACRGNDGAAWTIRNNLKPGVSLLEMENDIDAGGIWATKELQLVHPVSGASLNNLMKQELLNLFTESWPLILAGEIYPKTQEVEINIFTRRQTNIDRVKRANEYMTLGEAVSWILAHDFSPGTTAEMLNDNGIKYRLRVTLEKVS